MADTTFTQSWVAECSWNGRKPFLIGTFFTNCRDGIEAARRKAAALAVEEFGAILPDYVPPPDNIVLRPGMIVAQIMEEALAHG